jgi:hypothetical protein
MLEICASIIFDAYLTMSTLKGLALRYKALTSKWNP